MSTFFEAYVIFGVKVKRKILTKYDNKRGCSHEETDKNFCAICGAPMWKTLRYKVELNDFANSVDDVSYYYSSDPSENDDIVIGFLVNMSDCIDELTELTNAQKQHYIGNPPRHRQDQNQNSKRQRQPLVQRPRRCLYFLSY
jgi:hypothetical protein